MRSNIDTEQYWQFLRDQQDKYDLDLNPRHYETFAERDFNFRDLATPATAVSLAGLALVLDGCRDLSKIENVTKIGIGRGFDLVDGAVARAMNQSSDAGALVDAGVDKLGMFWIGRAAWKQRAMPRWFITSDAAIEVSHFGLTAAAAYRHPSESFRPPQAAKHAMLYRNLAGGAYLYANAYEHERPELAYHTNLRRAGRAAAAISLGYETPALREYANRVFKNNGEL